MRALVVDDAVTVRRYHAAVLEKAGFEVDTAMNGLEALERSLSMATPADLLVIDVNMPRMDGYACLRELRSYGSLQATPAIVVTTECGTEDDDRAFAAGANCVLHKPVAPEQLAAIACLLAGSDGCRP